MIIKTEKLDNVKPCIYCGKFPELITECNLDLSGESQKISCQTNRQECMILNYVQVYNDNIEEAINIWNEKNKL
ncbi:MAG: hypothetical protein IKP65_02430 [Alphaproteobacteria bacterium]|nr:hypothetical protein [Alphaproteobacteria bacterium]